jgi:hypothetical protein
VSSVATISAALQAALSESRPERLVYLAWLWEALGVH